MDSTRLLLQLLAPLLLLMSVEKHGYGETKESFQFQLGTYLRLERYEIGWQGLPPLRAHVRNVVENRGFALLWFLLHVDALMEFE